MTSNVAICPSCGEASLAPTQKVKVFTPPSGEVVVTLLSNVCTHCGAKVTTSLQRAKNLEALAARRSAYGEWLTGEEVLSLRKKYGITQLQASELFGKGKIAFSRYENEATYPDLTMTRLMRLALNDAGVMKRLAIQAQIELPLLEKRIDESLLQLRSWLNAAVKQLETTGGATRVGAGSVTVDRLFAAFAQKPVSTRSVATTAGGATASSISAANDERFALAA